MRSYDDDVCGELKAWSGVNSSAIKPNYKAITDTAIILRCRKNPLTAPTELSITISNRPTTIDFPIKCNLIMSEKRR